MNYKDFAAYSIIPFIIGIALSVGTLSGCNFIRRNTVELIWDKPATQAGVAQEGRETDASMASLTRGSFTSDVGASGLQSQARQERLDTTDSVSTESAIEIVWKVPEVKVDGYIIRYGLSKEDLHFEKRVKLDELRRTDDSEYGEVFRFLLREAPKSKPLFVSLAAFRGELVSAPTPVFEVQP